MEPGLGVGMEGEGGTEGGEGGWGGGCCVGGRNGGAVWDGLGEVVGCADIVLLSLTLKKRAGGVVYSHPPPPAAAAAAAPTTPASLPPSQAW